MGEAEGLGIGVAELVTIGLEVANCVGDVLIDTSDCPQALSSKLAAISKENFRIGEIGNSKTIIDVLTY